MQFTKIRLDGLKSIDFPIIGATNSDPYILKSAEGLGPPAVDLFIGRTLGYDGFYNGRQTQYREPVFDIRLNPNYQLGVSVSDLRSDLYGLLSSSTSDEVKISILNQAQEIMYTKGFIKRMEILPFSESPGVKLSFSCLQPYFLAPSYLHVDVPVDTTIVIENQGSAETGFVFKIQLTENCSSFWVEDLRSNRLELIYDFLEDDIIHVDTRPGHRGVWLTRTQETETLLHAITMESKWVQLYGGVNNLHLSSESFEWQDLYYVPQFWGI